MSKDTESKTEEAKKAAEKWMKEKGSKALESLEDLYKEDKCASMCETPLFFWGISIEQGPPKTDCLNAAVTAMSDGTGPAGAVALLSFPVLPLSSLLKKDKNAMMFVDYNSCVRQVS